MSSEIEAGVVALGFEVCASPPPQQRSRVTWDFREDTDLFLVCRQDGRLSTRQIKSAPSERIWGFVQLPARSCLLQHFRRCSPPRSISNYERLCCSSSISYEPSPNANYEFTGVGSQRCDAAENPPSKTTRRVSFPAPKHDKWWRYGKRISSRTKATAAWPSSVATAAKLSAATSAS